MDAITLLKDDHKAVERLFKRFENAGEHAYVEKRDVADRIIEELSKHAAIEEQLFYPTARVAVPDTDDIALESIEEHHIVKWLLDELEGMDPSDERFDAKVTVLIENVRHHVEEEESEFFPKVRDELGRNALNDLGDTMVQAKKVAPTHPHPRSPDTPPGNLVIGLAAGVIDRVTDTVSGIAQGAVTATQDLIAVMLRKEKPKVSPVGSTVTRKQAAKVRTEASDVTDAAVAKARSTVRTAEKKVAQTKTTAKRTTSTATKGAQTTARTAKAGAKRTATTAKTAASKTTGAAKSAGRSTKAAAKPRS